MTKQFWRFSKFLLLLCGVEFLGMFFAGDISHGPWEVLKHPISKGIPPISVSLLLLNNSHPLGFSLKRHSLPHWLGWLMVGLVGVNGLVNTEADSLVSWNWLRELNANGSSDCYWCLSFCGLLRPDLSPWGYRDRCFLVAFWHLIVRRLNLEVLLHKKRTWMTQLIISMSLSSIRLYLPLIQKDMYVFNWLYSIHWLTFFALFILLCLWVQFLILFHLM